MSPLRIGSLCSGYGGLDMAVQAVLGGEIAWVADPDPGAAAILTYHHPDVPNLGDIKLVDWGQVEPVDILTGGYPCQPFSAAGKRKGVEDERHLWPWIVPALRVLRPRLAIFENVANHLGLGFDTVLADLAALRFDVEWCTVRASEVGAPHGRRRLVFIATPTNTKGDGWNEGRAEPARLERRPDVAIGGRAAPTDTNGDGRAWCQERDRRSTAGSEVQHRDDINGCVLDWGTYEPAIRQWEAVLGRPAPRPTEPGANGQPRLTPPFVEWMMGLSAGHVTAVPGLSRNAQLRLLGNGVVPQQGAAAIAHLLERRAAA